eukprot:12301318-Heterocapsa_arctica.AAC.1
MPTPRAPGRARPTLGMMRELRGRRAPARVTTCPRPRRSPVRSGPSMEMAMHAWRAGMLRVRALVALASDTCTWLPASRRCQSAAAAVRWRSRRPRRRRSRPGRLL